MPYTIDNPPEWLKSLPEGAIKIGVETFNAVMAENKDEEAARTAAWANIKAEYQKGEDGTWERITQSEDRDEVMSGLVRVVQARGPEGTDWDVLICAPGFTLNGWYHPEAALREAAALFEGADVNIYEMPGGANHVADGVFPLKSLLTKNKAGWLDNVRYVAGEGLKGVLHFLDSFAWLGKNLLKAKTHGQDAYGLSYDAPVKAKKSIIYGRTVMELITLHNVDSVDIVTRPAAGGKFIRAVAAVPNTGGRIMSREELLAMIKAARPDLLEGKDEAAFTDEEIKTLAQAAMKKVEPPADRATASAMKPEDIATKNDLALFRSQMALDKALDKSDLPEGARDRIRVSFAEKIFEAKDLEKVISAEKDYLASIEDAARKKDDPAPGTRIAMGLNSARKVEMAIDRTFGLTRDDMVKFSNLERLDHQRVFMSIGSAKDFDAFHDVPAFRSLGEMYALLTGDPEVTGRFNSKNIPLDLRSSMAITSSTFSYLLGNTLGRRMINEYQRADFNEGVLISTKKPVKDFREQEAVKIGGFPDLEDVNPETGDYQEIAAITDEESTYTVTTRGNILTISRKTIINDDIFVVQRFVDKLGRTGSRTHAKFVWGFFINNSTCSDGTAWFTSGHGNLGSSALTIANAYAALVALAKMTEKDSGERLGLLDRAGITAALVHPPDLQNAANAAANDDFYYTSNDLTTKTSNPCKGKVRPVQCSLLTDPTDWGIILPGTEVDNVEMGYLQGREMPEMFMADTPQSEQVFVADNIRYKIRHEYSGTPVDYVGAYKAVV